MLTSFCSRLSVNSLVSVLNSISPKAIESRTRESESLVDELSGTIPQAIINDVAIMHAIGMSIFFMLVLIKMKSPLMREGIYE